jgi:hypothetical protein
MRYTCAVWVRFFSLLDKKPFLLSDPIQELDLSPLSIRDLPHEAA